jgi:hypothetical protein
MSDPSNMYHNIINALIREEMAKGPGPMAVEDDDNDIIMDGGDNSVPLPPSTFIPRDIPPSLDYAYQAHELVNLELMKRHEGNSWRAYNQDMEQARDSMQVARQSLATGLEQTVAKRKREKEEQQRQENAKRRQLSSLMQNVAAVKRALGD